MSEFKYKTGKAILSAMFKFQDFMSQHTPSVNPLGNTKKPEDVPELKNSLKKFHEVLERNSLECPEIRVLNSKNPGFIFGSQPLERTAKTSGQYMFINEYHVKNMGLTPNNIF